jgi:bifunctional DNase/RNase
MLIEAEIWTVARTEQGNAVLVRPIDSEVAVPIFIGQLEAQSILIGMGNVPMPRPLTHDLFLSVLDKLEANITRIEITELKEGTFYAQLILKQNGKDIIIDSRPSDSIAIAVREKCPIYIDEAVIEEASVPVSVITESTVKDEGEGESGVEETEGEKIEEASEVEEGESPQEEELEDTAKESEKKKLEKELNKAIEEENYEEAARLRDKINELSDKDKQ